MVNSMIEKIDDTLIYYEKSVDDGDILRLNGMIPFSNRDFIIQLLIGEVPSSDLRPILQTFYLMKLEGYHFYVVITASTEMQRNIAPILHELDLEKDVFIYDYLDTVSYSDCLERIELDTNLGGSLFFVNSGSIVENTVPQMYDSLKRLIKRDKR